MLGYGDMMGYGGICWDMVGYVRGGGLHVAGRPRTCFAKVSLLSPMVSTFA